MFDLPTEVAAWYRIGLLVFVAGSAFALWRREAFRRETATLVCVCCGLVSHYFFLAGNLAWSGIAAAPYVSLIAWLLIERMRLNPKVLVSQLSKAQEELHHCRGELAAERVARQVADLRRIQD